MIEIDPPGWTRRDIPEAHISIATNPAWPTYDQPYGVYQMFGRGNGAISIQWGEEATMEWFVAHVRVGSGGHSRVIDEDRPVKIGDCAGRRVRLRLISTARGHSLDAEGQVSGTTVDDVTIFVAVALEAQTYPCGLDLVCHPQRRLSSNRSSNVFSLESVRCRSQTFRDRMLRDAENMP